MGSDVKYHVHLNREMLEGAEVAILPGDPGRVGKTARYLDPDAHFVASNREFTSWLATLDGHKVLVCSTGIGGPSVSICLEELASLGITDFYRIGTTGAIQPDIELGSLIITTGAVRLDGASTHYAPIEYPAVADLELTNSLVAAAREFGLPHRVGITAACDTFYPGQERYDTFTGYVPRRFQGSLEEWRHLQVLNYEMESATLFVIASVFGLKAGMVASAIVSRARSETPDDTVLALAEENLARVMKRALQIRFASLS
ncbi:MAG TPA: uridine phosphorylase [Thermoanaerobaculaceae bacterium]|nr:uridine phosphorylase [Thermoanaerobaculaceae bacterium]HRS14620.1 uridine phosphorylase [Thermoanaerobaculaceae bacterium]